MLKSKALIFLAEIKIYNPTFAANLVPDFKPGLKGNPVKNGSYPRSCKLCKLFVLQATVL